MSEQDLLADLRKPFPLHDLEWMLTPGTVTKKGSVIRAKCLAYVTARAVQARLDEVVGPSRWQIKFERAPNSVAVPFIDETGKSPVLLTPAPMAGIGILIDGEWVWKWDAAENTDIEPIKGGISNAMKRAGAQWGIGRYLYHLPEAWAIVNTNGRYYWGGMARAGDKKERVSFKWDNPSLPDWALPSGGGTPPPEVINDETGEIPNSGFHCPECSSPMWDNRAHKAADRIGNRQPDLRCSNSRCGWSRWMDTWSNEILGELEAAYKADLLDNDQYEESRLIVHDQVVETMLKMQKKLDRLAHGG